jgi:AbiV family abortive infection protein
MKKRIISTKQFHKFERIGVEAIKNGIRLHFDSFSLYLKKSYPSAYLLSALAQEELGKSFMIDGLLLRALDNFEDEDEDGIKFWGKFKKDIFRSHANKQGFLISEATQGFLWDIFKYKAPTNAKEMDAMRQKASFVGLSRDGRILSPLKFSPIQTKRQIEFMNRVLLAMSDRAMEDPQYFFNHPVAHIVDRKEFRRQIFKIGAKLKFETSEKNMIFPL